MGTPWISPGERNSHARKSDATLRGVHARPHAGIEIVRRHLRRARACIGIPRQYASVTGLARFRPAMSITVGAGWHTEVE